MVFGVKMRRYKLGFFAKIFNVGGLVRMAHHSTDVFVVK